MAEWILQVEDEESDVLLLRHAFAQAGVKNPVRVAGSGQEAIDYLAGMGDFANRKRFPMPRFVLLDLKLPGLSGQEVLEWIRRQRGLDGLRVAMLSSSPYPGDIKAAFRAGADAYLVKPCTTEERVKLAEEIKESFLKGDPTVSLGPAWRVGRREEEVNNG
jgi:CheY-like chemotaxis protein